MVIYLVIQKKAILLMKTLIAYSTNHGCTEKTAQQLKQYLGENITLVNLKKDSNPELKKYERVIIGGSIHAGQIQKRVKTFCTQNITELKSKELGLFICCMEEGEKAQLQFSEAYPSELQESAKATACFGGEFNFDKMNFFEKMVVKKIAHVNESTSKMDIESIKRFSSRMNQIFNPFLFLV